MILKNHEIYLILYKMCHFIKIVKYHLDYNNGRKNEIIYYITNINKQITNRAMRQERLTKRFNAQA